MQFFYYKLVKESGYLSIEQDSYTIFLVLGCFVYLKWLLVTSLFMINVEVN